jgi:hypothetical protein
MPTACLVRPLALGLLLALAAAATAGGDEEEVPLDKVPAAARKAAEKEFPKAKWLGATRETVDGVVVYTLDGELRKDKAVAVEVTAAGVVREVSVEVAMADVPEVVRAALKAKLPRFKVDDVFEVSRGGKVVEYQFEGKRPAPKKGKKKDAKDEEVTVTVSADGKTVEIDDD